jgi:hypothetical protein
MKNEKAITKTIFTILFLTGGIAIASTSPYFASRAIPALIKDIKLLRDKKKKRYACNIFCRLKNQELIKIEYRGKQMYISLTDEGKKKAGKYQIDDLEIKKPRRWDKKWRVLIFDIKNKDKIKREALRGKLKELGLYQLQKSVWVCPYNFEREVEILRTFFGFGDNELITIDAARIDKDKNIKLFFNLR